MRNLMVIAISCWLGVLGCSAGKQVETETFVPASDKRIAYVGRVSFANSEAPLFTFLKSQRPFGGFDANHPLSKLLDEMLSKADPNYKDSPDIKWNFTKFLIDKKGLVKARFEPTDSMEKVAEQIEAIL